jgi:hypothetical protein
VCPSPIVQETVSGVATAVTLRPPAVAVALKLCQLCPSIQSHELKFTMLNEEGLMSMTGEGSVRESEAFRAKAFGVTGAAPDTAGITGNHERAPL